MTQQPLPTHVYRAQACTVIILWSYTVEPPTTDSEIRTASTQQTNHAGIYLGKKIFEGET